MSIVIPCFNGARYISRLAQCLAPVAAARPGGSEVIFVDDGSTDQSADLARNLLPDARFVQQQNRGLSAARNAGAAVAKGEYLQLLDVDDTIEPQKLHVQAAAADKAGADAVYSDWRLLTVDAAKLARTEVFAPAEAPCEMVEALLGDWYVPPVGYLFRRSAYLDLGGCAADLKVWQDFDLYLRMAIGGRRHHYVPGLLSNYYRYLDVQSLARRNLKANALEREHILRKALAHLKQQDGLTISRRRAAAHAFFRVLRIAGIADPSWLHRMVATIYELDPEYEPQGTRAYRTISQVAGLVNAELVGTLLRRMKARLKGKTCESCS